MGLKFDQVRRVTGLRAETISVHMNRQAQQLSGHLPIRMRQIVLVLLIMLFTAPSVIAAATADRNESDQNESDQNESDKILSHFVLMDGSQDTQYAVVVEKSSQQIFLYAHDGRFREVMRFSCSTGENIGRKTRSGDGKTPEGVYFFIKEHPKRDLSETYGTRAFPMDYPNLLDRREGHTGNSIWMHGTNKPLKPRDSNGCVTLNNDAIDRVAPYIQLHRTPIIIVDRLRNLNADGATHAGDQFMGLMEQWKAALQNGTYHEYLSFFSPGYVPDIRWWSNWNRLRKDIAAHNFDYQINFSDLAVYRHRNRYVALFDLHVRVKSEDRFVARKKLYLAEEEGQLRIVGDEYQLVPGVDPEKLHKGLAVAEPLVAGAEKITESLFGEQDIAATISDWLAAWSAKDIRRYGQYYAQDFRSKGMNRRAWINYKKRLNRKYRFIRVTQDDLIIRHSKRQTTASFVQTYQSDQYKIVGRKKLVLKKENDGWKIYRELWRKM